MCIAPSLSSSSHIGIPSMSVSEADALEVPVHVAPWQVRWCTPWGWRATAASASATRPATSTTWWPSTSIERRTNTQTRRHTMYQDKQGQRFHLLAATDRLYFCFRAHKHFSRRWCIVLRLPRCCLGRMASLPPSHRPPCTGLSLHTPTTHPRALHGTVRPSSIRLLSFSKDMHHLVSGLYFCEARNDLNGGTCKPARHP